MTIPVPSPDLDLQLEREVDVPPEPVWAAWTQPDQLVKWFTPAPWTTTECEIDLRPGGLFRTLMRSPEGEDFPNVGCYLEVVPNERLAFTDAFTHAWQPSEKPFMSVVLTFEDAGEHELKGVPDRWRLYRVVA